MKKTITTYTCDLCQETIRELDESVAMVKINTMTTFPSPIELDLCRKCFLKFDQWKQGIKENRTPATTREIKLMVELAGVISQHYPQYQNNAHNQVEAAINILRKQAQKKKGLVTIQKKELEELREKAWMYEELQK